VLGTWRLCYRQDPKPWWVYPIFASTTAWGRTVRGDCGFFNRRDSRSHSGVSGRARGISWGD
jgi:hypothetical protein